MTAEGRKPDTDERLSRLLARWEPPVVPDGLDGRVLEAWRKQAGLAPTWWQRLVTSSIRVPVPVALVVVLLLLVTAALALRPSSPSPTATSPASSAPVQAAQAAPAAPPIVTGTSLAGFQPVTEVTATVVQEGNP